jgi:hypothetical protein
MHGESVYSAREKSNEHMLTRVPGHIRLDGNLQRVICLSEGLCFMPYPVLEVGFALGVGPAQSI